MIIAEPVAAKGHDELHKTSCRQCANVAQEMLPRRVAGP